MTTIQQLAQKLTVDEATIAEIDRRLTKLEIQPLPTIESVLAQSNNAEQLNMINLNTLTVSSIAGVHNISSNSGGLLSGFINIDTQSRQSAQIASTATGTVITYAPPNSTTGYFEGSIVSKLSVFNFRVFCKSQAGVALIVNYITETFSDGDRISFDVSGPNVLVNMYNNAGINQIYTSKFTTNFIPV